MEERERERDREREEPYFVHISKMIYPRIKERVKANETAVKEIINDFKSVQDQHTHWPQKVSPAINQGSECDSPRRCDPKKIL